jgi:hypothetical protein
LAKDEIILNTSIKLETGKRTINLANDFKLSPWFECCVLSFDSAYKIQMPGNHPKERIQQF